MTADTAVRIRPPLPEERPPAEVRDRLFIGNERVEPATGADLGPEGIAPYTEYQAIIDPS